MQKVELIARMCGDYASFHEISIYCEYDITNDIQLGDYTKKELEKFLKERGDYCDYGKVNGYLINGKHYIDPEF